MSTESAREELAEIAASLRAYLEQHRDAGAVGVPRGARAPRPAFETAEPAGDAPHAPPAPRPARPPAEAPPPAARRPLPDFLLEAAPPVAHDPGAAAGAPAVGSFDGPPASREPAPAARALPVVADEVAGCTKCGLSATRTNTVFARGSETARIAFVGEAPGADEDAQGVPFVGRAGQLLDKMIVAMGLDPAADVYVCNIVKCRPPGNRRPEDDEMAACLPYLHEQLAAVKPAVIVAMGNTAVSALLGTKLGITKLRGSWKLYRGHTKVMPTYHPSYLLRPSPQQAEAKRQAWEDLKLVMKDQGLKGQRRA